MMILTRMRARTVKSEHYLTEACLRQLPRGLFVRFDRLKDRGSPLIVVWRFWDDNWREDRLGMFSVKDGVYMGDCLK